MLFNINSLYTACQNIVTEASFYVYKDKDCYNKHTNKGLIEKGQYALLSTEITQATVLLFHVDDVADTVRVLIAE